MRPFKTVLVAVGQTSETGIHTGVTEFPEWAAKYLADHGIDNVVAPCRTREDLETYASDADVVWLFSGDHILTAETIPVLKKCGAILKVGSGVDNIDVEAATRLGIIVANTPEVVTGPVAEHTIALLLAAARNVVRQNDTVRHGEWEGVRVYDLSDSTLGLVGFGRVGRAVLERLSGFGMCFLVYDPYVSPAEVAEAGARSLPLPELLSQSDFVSLHCNLTAETRGLMGETELRLMKKDAILINMSRGPVVDEDALYRALSQGWIAGAATDVMQEEPPPHDHRLIGLDNLIITPHMAGRRQHSPDAQWMGLCRALVTMSQLKWPESFVNKDVVPRWEWLKTEA